jgi:drug/metabolite transporter (DMT)-like permease
MNLQLAETFILPMPDDPGLRMMLGIVAALGSTACWVFTSVAFTIAGRRYGSTTVNVTRCVISAVVLLVVVRLIAGTWFPIDNTEQILWLALSGVAGLAIGDQFLFTAFNRVGPRRTLLVLNLAPIMTALLAWPILGESLVPLAWLGMAVTIMGIAWVILERSPQHVTESPNSVLYDPRLGIILALLGTIAISIGNALAKLGMVSDTVEMSISVDPLVAQNVRMFVGTASIVLLAAVASIIGRRIGTPREPDASLRPPGRTAIVLLLLGTLFGPLLGIWLFLVSAALVKLAISATIVALTPVAILPFSHIVEGTPLTKRAVLGAVVAVLGVALLTLSEPPPSPSAVDHLDNGSAPQESLDFPP